MLILLNCTEPKITSDSQNVKQRKIEQRQITFRLNTTKCYLQQNKLMRYIECEMLFVPNIVKCL